MRILFMGTPDIAAESLRTLIEAGHELCGVFTREDKPVGRKRVLTAPPVKVVAQEQGIPVYQPKTLRDGEAARIVAQLAPEIVVVVAYGRLIPPEILSMPRYGCINLHVSLLPKYRGSAPIQWAVIHGEKQTGVTIMQLNEGMDTGDILMVSPVEIGPEETSGELFDRVSALGAKTLVKCLEELRAGRIVPQPQDHAQATSAPPLTKEMACFDFSAPAQTLHDLVRGMNPWPMAYFLREGKRIKVLEARVAPGQPDAAAGAILHTKPLTVQCGQGALTLVRVVPEGGKPMPGEAWALGQRFAQGDRL